MPTSPETNPRPVVMLCYIGAVNNGDEVDHLYKPVVDGKLVDRMLFGKPLMVCMPGTLFTVEKNPDKDGSYYTKTAKYAGQWQNDEDRVRWCAESRAVENAAKESKEAKKAMSANAALERLTPFKEAYHRLRPDGRRAMLAEVIRFITT